MSGQEYCSVDGCERVATAVGMCDAHRRRFRKTGDAGGPIVRPDTSHSPLSGFPECSVEGCEKQSRTKSGDKLCQTHYKHKRQGKDLRPITHGQMADGAVLCSIDGCGKLAISSRMCVEHGNKCRSYNLNPEELGKVLSVGRCENRACTDTWRLSVDHDHETGRVRGLLCSRCNTALGYVADSPARLVGLAEYVTRTSSEPSNLILGIDPGFTTGVAMFRGVDLAWSGAVPGGFEGFMSWWLEKIKGIHLASIVVEQFVPLEGFRGNMQTHPLQIQGAIRALAGAPVTLQMRSDKATLFNQEFEGERGQQERYEWFRERGMEFDTPHEMDAATHVLVARKRARDLDFWRRYWT